MWNALMRTWILLVDSDYKSKVFNGLLFLRTIYYIEKTGEQIYKKKKKLR